ncbi:nuclear transport factor 2 family protein [Lutimonas zeaxanthinifaciens]|uniref:nuclear transport factor 2 family protein n=1 Tax=Lutimonas zeaxanthinifaciens TaxID=3060215 RepID=UPI00265C98E1|nr:nuclear transport factor 2 family protein [Lutimonas sp. YSD2104]WKK67018.1 nuclear transport factor 2 family protein [Lutimonas sp. YSD2104]
MRTIFLFGIIAVLTFSCNNNDQKSQVIDQKQLENELKTSIESRFYAWQDNDYETYVAGYHPDWKRWGMREDVLNKSDDIRGFWDYMKANEESQEMEIEMVDYNLIGDGNVAIVHYTSAETFKWTGPDNQRGWKTGDIYKGFARWSDILVKEDGKWLCIGGHRDRSQSAAGLIKLN